KIKVYHIALAESVQHSHDCRSTTLKYRDLMTEWKKSPRSSRKEDDALWGRFRCAQDIFFKARDAANAEIDREYEANLKIKEQLIKEEIGRASCRERVKITERRVALKKKRKRNGRKNKKNEEQ